jgi:hypothetical protein
MELRIPTKEIVPFGLRAMKTVALANGRIDQLARDLLSAAQAVLGTTHDVDALRRGAACKVDPTDSWDPWPVMDRPLEALRAEYGIPPLPAAVAGSVPV